MTTPRHARPATSQPAVPEPSFAERARTLMYLGRIGSLSTLSRKQPGFPFGSVMPYALEAHGRPIFLISTMAMHTQNLQSDPRAALLVTQNDSDTGANADPLGASQSPSSATPRPFRPPKQPSRASFISLVMPTAGIGLISKTSLSTVSK